MFWYLLICKENVFLPVVSMIFVTLKQLTTPALRIVYFLFEKILSLLTLQKIP